MASDDDDAMPVDPVTGLAAAAAMHHEWYLAWQNAGFSDAESFELLKIAVAAAFRTG